MLECVMSTSPGAGGLMVAAGLGTARAVVLIIVGFSLVIFVHELGHFIMAKLADVRVERFAVGFGRALFAYRRGVGLRFGSTEEEYRRRIEEHVLRKRAAEGRADEGAAPSDSEIAAAQRELGLGETEYAFNALPLGGYVKMLGQEDFAVDKSGEWTVRQDPRSFTNKPVGWRALIVSAGVVMNLVFAALTFMVVFMIGFEFPTAVIGTPLPGSPAEQAGLQYGDRIVEINGAEIRDYGDIRMAVVLAEPHTPLRMKVERDGRLVEIRVTPENDPDQNVLQVGVPPKTTLEIWTVLPDPGAPEPGVRAGDVIRAVAGRPVREFTEVLYALRAARGRPVPLTVERTDPAQPDGKARVEVLARARLVLLPSAEVPHAPGHVLGLAPRQRFTDVDPKGRAALHGIRSEDVIVQWEDIEAPTAPEIARWIEEHPDDDAEVHVLRDGRAVRTVIRPRRSGLLAQGKPEIGADFDQQELDRVVVADIIEKVMGRPTPAASLKNVLPRGATITKVDGETVTSWSDLANRLMERAGREVQLTWRYGSRGEAVATLRVPHDVQTLAGLPPLAKIVEINGRRSREVQNADGRVRTYAAGYWLGAYHLLRDALAESPDEPVTIKYVVLNEPSSEKTVEVRLTEEQLDPWTLRVQYQPDRLINTLEMVTVQTWNPAKALWIGIGKTYDFILQAYLTMKRMIFTRSVGVENISGPVGIISVGISMAETGMTKLAFYLAFLSANLAVINFLPLPIVDGGLMVFLLIEKIKGRPVSVKTQVVTQIIGLALIIAAFVFVTFMDISKL